MALAFHCPQCRQPLPVSPGMLGQKVQCAGCQASFILSPAHLQAPAGGEAPSTPAAPRSTNPPVTTPVVAAATATLPAPTSIAEPLRPLPPVAANAPAPSTTARVNASNKTVLTPPSTTLKPTADGKLPQLALYSEATRVEKSGPSSGPSTLLVIATLAVSVALSLAMLLFDFSPTVSPTGEVEAARLNIQKFFGNDQEPLKPYEKLLRESQRAHSRGDRKTERQCYRDVLELLRAEGRGLRKTLTGTAGDDQALENDLTVLLRSTAETSFLP